VNYYSNVFLTKTSSY